MSDDGPYYDVVIQSRYTELVREVNELMTKDDRWRPIGGIARTDAGDFMQAMLRENPMTFDIVDPCTKAGG